MSERHLPNRTVVDFCVAAIAAICQGDYEAAKQKMVELQQLAEDKQAVRRELRKKPKH